MTATTLQHSKSQALDSTIKDYFTLLKPGVLSLVVFSGAVGLWMAPGSLHPLTAFLTVLSIAMGSGAGGAINMWYDRDIDAVMKRTSTRPIPAGRVAPGDALALGIFLAIFSVEEALLEIFSVGKVGAEAVAVVVEDRQALTLE